MISIAILCGGMSKRFESDKATYRLKGKPMVLHVYDELMDLSDDIFLQTSDTNIQRIRENMPGLGSIYCDIGESGGSLIGIYSALKHARHERVFIVGCDMPLIDKRLLKILLHSGDGAVVVRWRDGRVEPLGSIYSKKHLDLIDRMIQQHKMRINGFLDTIPKDEIEYIEFEGLIEKGLIDKHCFVNINMKGDLEKVND